MSICALIKLVTAPTASTDIFTSGSVYAGLTTASTSSTLNLFGAGNRLYNCARLLSLEDGNSADASKGQGFLAESIEGTMKIADAGISGALSQKTLSFIGATLFFGDYETSGGIYQQHQRVIYDQDVNTDGTVTLKLRGALGVSTATLHSTKTFMSHPSDAYDSNNPIDPTYADSPSNWKAVIGYAGTAFGNTPTSIHATTTLPVCKLAHWTSSQEFSGDISNITNLIMGQLVSTTGDTYGPRVLDSHGVSTTQGAGMLFRCRYYTGHTMDEANRFVAQMDAYQAAGYRIILGDGSWFLDFIAQDMWQGVVQFAPSATTSSIPNYYKAISTTGGAGIFVGVAFNLTDVTGRSLVPASFDPTKVSVYAVPTSMLISSGAVDLVGVVRGAQLVSLSGTVTYDVDSNTTTVTPTNAADGGYVSADTVSFTPLCTGVPVQGSTLSLAASGDTAQLNVNPETRWYPGQPQISMSGSGSLIAGTRTLFYFNICVGLESLDADSICSDVSFTLTLNVTNSSSILDNISVGLAPPFSQALAADAYRFTAGMQVISNTSNSLTLESKAPLVRTTPNWDTNYQDLKALNGINTTPIPAPNPLKVVVALAHSTAEDYTFNLREIFLWAFRKISFTDTYAVVFPGPRQDMIQDIDCGDAVVVAVGGKTLSVAYPTNIGGGSYSDPSIWPWSNTELDNNDNGVPAVTAVALIGHATSTPYALAFGTRTSGGVSTMAHWQSNTLSAGAVPTWTEADGWLNTSTTNFGFCDDTNVMFGTADGYLWWSPASAISWHYPRLSTTASLLGAASSDPTMNVVVGTAGFLAYGALGSMTTLTAFTSAALRSVVFNANNLAWIIAADDGIWTCVVASTTTAPTTWTQRASGAAFQTVSALDDSGDGYTTLIATGATPMRAYNDGSTWTPFAYDFGDDLPTCTARSQGRSRVWAGSTRTGFPSLWAQIKGGTGPITGLYTPAPKQALNSITKLIGCDTGSNPVQMNGVTSWRPLLKPTSWSSSSSYVSTLSGHQVADITTDTQTGDVYVATSDGYYFVQYYGTQVWQQITALIGFGVPVALQFTYVSGTGTLLAVANTSTTSTLVLAWRKNAPTVVYSHTSAYRGALDFAITGWDAVNGFSLVTTCKLAADYYVNHVYYIPETATFVETLLQDFTTTVLNFVTYDSRRSYLYFSDERSVGFPSTYRVYSYNSVGPSITSVTTHVRASSEPLSQTYDSVTDRFIINAYDATCSGIVISAIYVIDPTTWTDQQRLPILSSIYAQNVFYGIALNQVNGYIVYMPSSFSALDNSWLYQFQPLTSVVQRPQFGIGFDPPSGTETTSTTPAEALQQIMKEWWGFAGEMPVTAIDASNDNIDVVFPTVNVGNIEDLATTIHVQFHRFGSSYLKTAYITNTNVAYDNSKGSSFYFSGWDDPSVQWDDTNYTQSNGYQIWSACAAAYTKTKILRDYSFSLDSVHAEADLGTMWLVQDPILGARVNHVCQQPRYLTVGANSNRQASSNAYCGAQYAHNPVMVQARSISLPSQGYVVTAKHDWIAGKHTVQSIYAP